MKTMCLHCCFFIVLLALSTPTWPSISAQGAKEQVINIAELLREADAGKAF
jgi:hypothetical protein